MGFYRSPELLSRRIACDKESSRWRVRAQGCLDVGGEVAAGIGGQQLALERARHGADGVLASL
jgi:hypothetical protein